MWLFWYPEPDTLNRLGTRNFRHPLTLQQFLRMMQGGS